MLQRLRVAAKFSLVMLTVATGACLDVEPFTPEVIPIEQTQFAPSLGVNLAASTRTTNGAYYRDITPGTGAVVVTGQTLTVRYTGWLANGAQFDSNVNLQTPFTFKLGTRAVIDGWDEAIPGMRVGGTRQLILPASLGYGPAGAGPIPGNAVLVFNVQVISAQ